MRAWLFQDHRQKEKLGADACPWSVGWIDPSGKRKSKSIGSESKAERYQRKIEGQLEAGTYKDVSRASWEQFKDEYESKVLAIMEPGTREAMQYAINHFERIVKPAKVRTVTTEIIDGFIAARKSESSRPKCQDKKAEVKSVSPATVNKELRCLRAMLRKAAKWGYLVAVPEFAFLREPGKLPTYVTPEHFTAIYQACEEAELPAAQAYTAADWWRALLMTAYMTGWRIGSLLALRWEDVNLEAGTAVSRAADNKGRRDQFLPLHPLVVEHIRRLKSFSPLVFAWNDGHIYDEFGRIQAAAKVRPTGKPRYGFHDLRRGFATMNADKLTPQALQALMQHKDYQTTLRYISIARQLNPAVAALYVPTTTPMVAVAN